MEEPVRQAWESYVEYYGAHFEKNYRRLILAEAWLRAEAEHRHGGARSKAGAVDQESVIQDKIVFTHR